MKGCEAGGEVATQRKSRRARPGPKVLVRASEMRTEPKGTYRATNVGHSACTSRKGGVSPSLSTLSLSFSHFPVEVSREKQNRDIVDDGVGGTRKNGREEGEGEGVGGRTGLRRGGRGEEGESLSGRSTHTGIIKKVPSGSFFPVSSAIVILGS